MANEEIFSSVQKELLFDSRLIKELHILFEDGVLRGELRNQDFFSVFGLMMGNLGGISFMYMQGLLENDISWYKPSVSENIYEALRVKSF